MYRLSDKSIEVGEWIMENKDALSWSSYRQLQDQLHEVEVAVSQDPNEMRGMLEAWEQFATRLRQQNHDRHDTVGIPIDTCDNWVCFHVGVYVRETQKTLLPRQG